MNQGGPLLTIGVPTYNRAKYLRRIINTMKTFSESTLSQVELLIVDNNSRDMTPKICKSQNYTWFRYFRNKKNIGATRNLFKIVDLCETPYLWWMGDDDSFTEDNVSKALQKLEEYKPDILVVNRLVESETKIICDNVLGHYLTESYAGELNDFIGRTGVLTGVGCISTLIFKPYKDEQLGKYFELKTSYPQLAYLIRNFGKKKGYFDLENTITTFTENSRPETYESGDLSRHLAKMATGIPKMYSFLFKDNSLDRKTIMQSREYSWGHSRLVNALSYHFFLYLRLCLVTRFSFEDMKNLFQFYWELNQFLFCFLVPIIWVGNQVMYSVNKVFLLLGINVIGIKAKIKLMFMRKEAKESFSEIEMVDEKN